MRQKAVDEARDEYLEGGRMSPPFGITEASVESDMNEARREDSEEGRTYLHFGITEARAGSDTDEARGEDSEEGRISLPFGITNTRAESDLSKPENEDARFIKPQSMTEAEALEAALEMTRVHYMNLTGNFAPSPPPFANYLTQWTFIQDQLSVYWISAGLSGGPPRLFILDPWTGGLGNWKYPNE